MLQLGRISTAGALTALAVFAAALGHADVAVAQARGVIIQIPDDVMPGAPRPAPPPAPPPVPAAPGAAGTPPACQGATCAPVKSEWHVFNTSNRTCLALSKADMKRSGDIRKLAALLPSPHFVVAAGGCP